MTLTQEWRSFIECLECNKVEYLVVGAIALAHHGLPRYTGDLDIWVRNSPTNAQRVVDALRTFGFGSLELKAEDFTGAYQVVQLGRAPRRIDLLTTISGVTFEEAWEERATGKVEGVTAPFIGVKALLRNKQASGRTQDRADAAALARLHGADSPNS